MESEGSHPFNEPLPPETPVIPHTNIKVVIPQFIDSKSKYEPVLIEIDYIIVYVIYQKAYQQAYQATEAQAAKAHSSSSDPRTLKQALKGLDTDQ